MSPGDPSPPQARVEDFHTLDIRCGVVVRALPFPEARKPAIQLWVDFGGEVGVLASSAQLTRHYTPEGLVGTEVLGVVNFPPRRIAGFRSECLVLGMVDPADSGHVVLVRPDLPITRGWRLG